MKSRYWKVAVIAMAICIIFTFAWTQSFHSIDKAYLTAPRNGNGTAIIVFSLSNVNVNGELQIQSNNATLNRIPRVPAPVNVIFENGTDVLVNSSPYYGGHPFSVNFHFNSSSIFQQGNSISGGFANISISNTDPLAVAMISNISAEFFLKNLPSLIKGYGNIVNSYAVYIDTYASVDVKVVGGVI